MKTSPKKGKYVSRSVYQKVCEENKRLKTDILILVQNQDFVKKLPIISKWRKVIEHDNLLNEMLRDMLWPEQMRFGPINEEIKPLSEKEIKKILPRKLK